MLFQLQAAATDIADVMAANLDFGVIFDHLAGLIHLLLIDKHDAGHDQGFCPLPALDKTILHQILIQSDFHDVILLS